MWKARPCFSYECPHHRGSPALLHSGHFTPTTFPRSLVLGSVPLGCYSLSPSAALSFSKSCLFFGVFIFQLMFGYYVISRWHFHTLLPHFTLPFRSLSLLPFLYFSPRMLLSTASWHIQLITSYYLLFSFLPFRLLQCSHLYICALNIHPYVHIHMHTYIQTKREGKHVILVWNFLRDKVSLCVCIDGTHGPPGSVFPRAGITGSILLSPQTSHSHWDFLCHHLSH